VRVLKVQLVRETSPGVERRNAEFDKENVVSDEGVKSTVERESEPAVTKRRKNPTLSSIQVNAQFVRVREEEDEMRYSGPMELGNGIQSELADGYTIVTVSKFTD
jgi:hypothetical protein